MSLHQPTPSEHRAMLSYLINRRRFLTLLGGAGAAGAVGCSASSSGVTQSSATNSPGRAVESSSVARPEPSGRMLADADPNRRLVVIELTGGNDGLAILQPTESGRLQDLRVNLATPDDELIDAGSGFGWHPALAGLAELGLSAAVGIGSNEPDFSHFEMEQRWWRGVSEDNSRIGTGFFGRLCDQLDVGDPVTGLSFSGGPTPALAAEKAVTVGLTDPGVSWFFNQEDPWFDTLRSTYGAMAMPSAGDGDRFSAARDGLADTLRFAEALGDIPQDDDNPYPWTDVGQQLRFAAEVLDLDVGVRIMHVRHGGFDTHTGQEWRHRELMTELNDATVAFVNDLKARGRLDDTLVVTTSEFGRRVPENDGGTDHGGASTMLVCGAGDRTGDNRVHGVAPDMSKLDDDNLVATARFEDYYATIAEDWFGIAAADVLPTGGTPITGLV